MARRIGRWSERKQRWRRAFLGRLPRDLLAPRRTLTEQLLDPPDRVSLLIQELSDLPQQIDVLWSIVSTATPALKRLDRWKFGFPETEDMGRKIEFFGNLSGRAIGRVRFFAAPGGCGRIRLGQLTLAVSWPQKQGSSHPPAASVRP